MLKVEGVRWLRHIIGALGLLAGGDSVGSTASTVVVGVASASALVVLVARDLTELSLAVGKSAVGAVWASLIHLEEFAFNSFEIVTESLSILCLSALVPLATTVVVATSFI